MWGLEVRIGAAQVLQQTGLLLRNFFPGTILGIYGA